MMDEFTVPDALKAKLEQIPNLGVYVGQIHETPPIDEDSTVSPYVLIWIGSGHAFGGAVGEKQSELETLTQLTCAGGTAEKCLWAVSKVRGTLTGNRLTIGDFTSHPLVEHLQNQTVRRDDGTRPARFWFPIQYRIVGTRDGF